MEPKTTRWLHISDLHMGCPGREVWWQVRSEFRESIRQHFQPIDMILVTGDLTFSAQPEQFDFFDIFLGELLGWLRQAGQPEDPLIIPVPGNHDLVWPPKEKLRNFRIMDNFWNRLDEEDIAYFLNELWRDRNAYFFEALFGNYTSWLERSILPRFTDREGVAVHRSHFPGDLSVFVDVPDRLRLTVVGLNSAWVQYTKGNFEGSIGLFTQQLVFALGDGESGSPLDVLDGRQNILLMHHPPTMPDGYQRAWFSPESSKRFNEEIYPPDRFLCCLHGHMHQGRSVAVVYSGTKFRYFFQAPSLFGLEHYGRSNETRVMGYAWGSMDTAGTVRVWPLKRDPQSGAQIFMWNTEFPPDPEGYRLRPVTDVSAPAVATVDIVPWLKALLLRTGYIEISGIGSGIGRTQSAARYPIEQLYTGLRNRDESGIMRYSGPVLLVELMSSIRDPVEKDGIHSTRVDPKPILLLIEGRPGAGKTTFLHLVATMLARDLLGIPCPNSPSWRQKYLGMDSRTQLVPLFLKLSELAIVLAKTEGEERNDDHRRLLDLAANTAPDVDDGNAWRKHWDGLLMRGEAVLLLDGLDEVADEHLRSRVFDIFRAARQRWPKAPMVMTSRPFGAEAVRTMGFHHAMIEDFGKDEVREFIRRWVATLHDLPIGQRPEGTAGEKSDRIIQTVLGRPAIRRLATNPLMLTCLCVVHWNEGELPEGRARLYQAVIRWMIAARKMQRARAGFSERFAHDAFAALAFIMMGGAGGTKAAVLDLELAAQAIKPLIARNFPQEEQRIRLAREWLGFECLYSGILEELRGGKVRFRHLTFQEFLAAQELAWRGDGDGTEDWWPVVSQRLADPQWRETIDLLPGMLIVGGNRRVDELLRRVIVRDKQPSLATDARVFGILTRVLGSMTAYDYRPPPDVAVLYQTLRDRILPIFERDGAARVPVRVRIEAAEALGRGGDPRLEGNKLIEVPDTDGVSLGKYLVTVQEYQAFVDADGYHDPKYWDQPGCVQREWEEPLGWDRQLEHPNWPVTGVSWYEAHAYCRWRSGDSVSTFRLPTEAEWQAAATPDGREYPWGAKEPNPEWANFGGSLDSATPVGVYPHGDGPFGHCDLAGNVWEWMEDVWDGTQESVARGRYSSRDRVYRGGSWFSGPRDLRSRLFLRNIPEYRDISLGFRVAQTLD